LKTNLPVIILKGIVLLPNNDIRLEFENDDSKNIVDISELFHDNKVLVVSQLDLLEEMPNIDELEKYGVVSKISHKMELPNGKVRVTINGLYRAEVHEYLNKNRPDDILESIISKKISEELPEKEEKAFIRKLYREMELYIKALPYVSNSVLSLVNNVTSLDKMTDIIIPYLQIDNKRTMKYLKENSTLKRLEMILEDIYSEKEMFQIEKQIDTKVRKEMEENQKEYILREKIKAIKQELGDSSLKDVEIEELKNQIKEIKAPENIKIKLENELKRYETLNASSPEVNTTRNYIDWLISLPWGKYTIDNDDLNEVRNKLDDSHNGLEKVKTRIIEYLAVKQMSGNLRSPIICLVGPPGVGKTTLAFSIAKAMKRNFVKISVGGITDEAELIGHRRTYIGANPGRIISSLKKAKSMNPVFLIDEIDKMSYSYKGDPASTMLEILDPEQNKYFSDNYIEEEFDLSKVMFVATANNIEDIPEALRDRLEIVTLSGYTEYEKLDIAKKYLLPKICKEHGVNIKGINIKDEVLLYIIRYYTKEAGVRELERQLSAIISNINRYKTYSSK
jgi:ATP-dependent Lon protease